MKRTKMKLTLRQVEIIKAASEDMLSFAMGNGQEKDRLIAIIDLCDTIESQRREIERLRLKGKQENNCCVTLIVKRGEGQDACGQKLRK